MISAPSRRICKKKCTSRSYNNGNSDCHSLHSSAFIENASSVTLSISCRYTWPRCTPSVVRHPVLSRMSFLLRAPSTSSAFCFLLSNDVVAVRHSESHPGAKCDTRRSLVNVRSTMEKSCVYDVVSSTESNFHLYDDERGRTYALERFSWWKNWWQSIRIAFSINGHFRLHLKNYTHVRVHTQFIQVEF